jgi:hypothetical protein
MSVRKAWSTWSVHLVHLVHSVHSCQNMGSMDRMDPMDPMTRWMGDDVFVGWRRKLSATTYGLCLTMLDRVFLTVVHSC